MTLLCLESGPVCAAGTRQGHAHLSYASRSLELCTSCSLRIIGQWAAFNPSRSSIPDQFGTSKSGLRNIEPGIAVL